MPHRDRFHVDESGETIRLGIPGIEVTSNDVRTLGSAGTAALDRWTESYALFRRPVLEASGLNPAAFGHDVLLVWRILLRTPESLHPPGAAPDLPSQDIEFN